MKLTSEKPIAKSFIGEDGTEHRTAYIDGYWFGDRILEGVPFSCHLEEDGRLTVEVAPGSGRQYVEQLNEAHWLEKALDFAVGNDIFCLDPSMSGEEAILTENNQD